MHFFIIYQLVTLLRALFFSDSNIETASREKEVSISENG